MTDREQDHSDAGSRSYDDHERSDAKDVPTAGEDEDDADGDGSADGNSLDAAYQPHCDFGAVCASGCETYRKIISHIFGRNKVCTRLIPDDAWVYFCRKHYQRIRFRTDTTWWPNTQCELVKTMLDRLEASGEAVGLDLALRAREKQRLKHAEENKHHRRSGNPRALRAGREASKNATRTGTTLSRKTRKPPVDIPAPVPAWLRQLAGPNKTFHEVRAIIDRIQADIIAQICQRTEGTTGTPRTTTRFNPDADAEEEQEEGLFPDIEILPRFNAEWAKARKRELDEKAALRKLQERFAAEHGIAGAALRADAQADTQAQAHVQTQLAMLARSKKSKKCSRMSVQGPCRRRYPPVRPRSHSRLR